METTEVVKLILEFIEKTGSAMFTSGFQVAVKYVIATAIGNLVGAIFCVLVFLASINNIYKIFPYFADDDLPPPNGKQFVSFVLYVAFAVISFFGFLGFSVIESTKMLIAPEWYAVLKIIDIVK